MGLAFEDMEVAAGDGGGDGLRGGLHAGCAVGAAEHAKGMPVSGLAAGFHAVAHLPADFDELEVREAARARSVGLYGMSTQRSSRSTTPGQLILGFGNVSDRTIRTGIAKIADLLI